MKELIDSSLAVYLPQADSPAAARLNQAIRDSMFPGGKRLRPILTLLGADVFGASGESVMRAACAVEFIHTSSLILDDLPCMDDAALRRGQPALHCVYGEHTALLAGIALLNQGYALFGPCPALIAEATECIGVAGMIGGQAVDLTAGSEEDTIAERDRKTSAMMRLAVTAGALAAGISPERVAPLGAAGLLLGQAFQIGDDLLDSHSGQHSGKTPNQDQRHNRLSHAVGLGAAEGKARMEELMATIRQTLSDAYGNAPGVLKLLGFMDKMSAQFAAKARQPAR